MMVVIDEAPFTLTEGETVTATVRVSPSTLTLAIPVMVTVEDATSDDYTVTPDQLTFSSTDLTVELTITAILDTEADEGVETFTISLTNDDPDIQFTLSSAGVTIADASETRTVYTEPCSIPSLFCSCCYRLHESILHVS